MTIGTYLYNGTFQEVDRDDLIDDLLDYECKHIDWMDIAEILRWGCQGWENMTDEELIDQGLDWGIIEEEKFFKESKE